MKEPIFLTEKEKAEIKNRNKKIFAIQEIKFALKNALTFDSDVELIDYIIALDQYIRHSRIVKDFKGKPDYEKQLKY